MTAAQLKAAVPDLPGQILDGLGWTEPDVAPEMRDWLLERLCAGNFAAYGRPSKPVPGDRAVRIPSKLFEFGKVDWRRSKLKGDGFAYGSITVCRPPGASAVPAIVNETSEAAETDADKRRRLVREAYARMIPKLPDRHTKTGICAEIAKQMKVSHGSLFPGEFGLDRSTICRHLKGMSGF